MVQYKQITSSSNNFRCDQGCNIVAYCSQGCHDAHVGTHLRERPCTVGRIRFWEYGPVFDILGSVKRPADGEDADQGGEDGNGVRKSESDDRVDVLFTDSPTIQPVLRILMGLREDADRARRDAILEEQLGESEKRGLWKFRKVGCTLNSSDSETAARNALVLLLFVCVVEKDSKRAGMRQLIAQLAVDVMFSAKIRSSKELREGAGRVVKMVDSVLERPYLKPGDWRSKSEDEGAQEKEP